MHDFPSYGESRYRRDKRRFDDNEPTTAKRVRRRRALPSIERFDATDGLSEGDRWTTWDQSDTTLPNELPAYCPTTAEWPFRPLISADEAARNGRGCYILAG